jgi:hypothetical protein
VSQEETQVSGRRALLVAGVHRSGTSAITRVLSLAGVDLPRTMMPANEANVRGYFESRLIYEAHELLFEETGTTWDDLAPFPPADWREQPWAEEWIDRLAGLVESEFGDSPLFVLKDPRICRLLPIWGVALERLGIEATYLVTVRNPLEVASSLKRQYATRHHRGLLLWLDHLISAERATRGQRRHFLAYEALLGDWRSALSRMQRDLELALPPMSREAEAEIDEFLDERLRHHDRSLDELKERTPIAEWVKTAYAWASEAAEGRDPSNEHLDRVAAALASAERAFGPLLAAEAADYKRRTKDTARELKGQKVARSQLRKRLERVQDARKHLILRSAERERELSRSALWIRNLFSFAVKTRWGELVPGDMMRELLGILKAADPGDVPELASAELRWIDGAREITHLERELTVLEEQRAAEAAEHEETVRDLRNERDGLASRLERALREGKAYATHMTEVGTQLALSEAEVSGLRAKLATLEGATEQRNVDLIDREHAVEQLRARIATLEASRSWRWMRPFRNLAEAIRAAFGS